MLVVDAKRTVQTSEVLKLCPAPICCRRVMVDLKYLLQLFVAVAEVLWTRMASVCVKIKAFTNHFVFS